MGRWSIISLEIFTTCVIAILNVNSKQDIKRCTKYEPCRTYLENKLYPSRESWARYSIGKIFTAGVESTQRVKSINGVLKKHLDRDTLLKELVREVERELDKEAHYSRLNDYNGSSEWL